MKQLLFTLLGLLSVLQAMANGFIYTYEGQMLKYQILSEDEKTVMVSGYNQISGDLVIPSIALDEEGVKYTVVKIGNDAFYGSYELLSVTIPNSVKVIGDSAFILCDNLTSVNFGNSITEIGIQAFSRCTELTSVNIPDSVIAIGDLAFSYCSQLASVAIPSSCISIGSEAFSKCIRLNSVIIPASVEIIGEKAFWGCDSLAEIQVDRSNKNFHSNDGVVFNNDDTILLFYPGGKGTEYSIPDSVIEIGEYAFCASKYLMIITIPDSVVKIGDNAFSECEYLIGVAIGNSVAEIGSEAFCGCIFLRAINIPASVIQIGIGAFSKCNWLEDINIEANNLFYQSIDGIVFNEDCSVLCIYPSGKIGEYIIPDSVTEIGEYAFHTCEGLTSVKLSDSVNSIGEGAFSGTGLTSIAIPDNITEIKDFTFIGCQNLTSVFLGKSVNSIGEWVFSNGIERIESSSLTPPSAFPNSFGEEMYWSTVIEVSENSLDAYKDDSVWGLFHNIISCDVESIITDSQIPISIFSISGECLYKGAAPEIINDLCSGVYIIRQGKTARKIVKP